MDDRWVFFRAVLRNPSQRRNAWRWLWSSYDPDFFIRRKKPWLTFDAIRRLDRMELRGSRIFEYGSGGSTLYWVERGALPVSVEHDRQWYELVGPLLPAAVRRHYHLVEPEVAQHEATPSDPADPLAYRSSAAEYSWCTFRAYASFIDRYPDETFDVVLVDGRSRPSCIRHAVPKLRRNGLLILDNAERTYYFDRAREFLEGFNRVSYWGVMPRHPLFTDTSFFVRRPTVQS